MTLTSTILRNHFISDSAEAQEENGLEADKCFFPQSRRENKGNHIVGELVEANAECRTETGLGAVQFKQIYGIEHVMVVA